eukprot:6901585-Alexandrium_andersonii.AAC.1
MPSYPHLPPEDGISSVNSRQNAVYGSHERYRALAGSRFRNERHKIGVHVPWQGNLISDPVQNTEELNLGLHRKALPLPRAPPVNPSASGGFKTGQCLIELTH